MKLYKKPVTAAEASSGETTWYRITVDQLLNNPYWKDNCWVDYLLKTQELDEILNLKSLEGSFVENNDLYFMDSDYQEIFVNGESVFPDEVVESGYTLEDLEPYVRDGSTEQVKKITELDLNLKSVDIDKIARDLLLDETLSKVASDAEEIGLIELR